MADIELGVLPHQRPAQQAQGFFWRHTKRLNAKAAAQQILPANPGC
jgi:hypothetical protein